MARALVALVALLAGAGHGAAEPPAPREPSFWERMGALQRREVFEVLEHASVLYHSASHPIQSEADLHLRELLLNDARGMLHYALRIAPDDRHVLATLALVEETSGHTERALALYRSLLDRQHQDDRPLPDHVCAHYGMLEARLDHVERALDILDQCVRREESTGVFRDSDAVISLSCLHASHGHMEQAIQVLEQRRRAHLDDPVIDMVLVALYDKDGQVNKALALFEDMRKTHEYHLFQLLDQSMGELSMVPPEERHYLTALLLELHGALPEAREEWHHYIRSGSRAVSAQRAREHIRAIDALFDQPRHARSRAP